MHSLPASLVLEVVKYPENTTSTNFFTREITKQPNEASGTKTCGLPCQRSVHSKRSPILDVDVVQTTSG